MTRLWRWKTNWWRPGERVGSKGEGYRCDSRGVIGDMCGDGLIVKPECGGICPNQPVGMAHTELYYMVHRCQFSGFDIIP